MIDLMSKLLGFALASVLAVAFLAYLWWVGPMVSAGLVLVWWIFKDWDH
jgi:hypothetical protein